MHESEEKVLSLCCVAKEEKKILLIVEKIIVCKSCVFERLVMFCCLHACRTFVCGFLRGQSELSQHGQRCSRCAEL